MSGGKAIKLYVENGIYHLYNRGVNKSDIFLDSQDFAVFCSYLKDYLLPKDTIQLQSEIASREILQSEKNKKIKLLKLKNFSNEISLLAYALLPNHFHLLIKQEHLDTIDRFLNAFATRYSIYFNRKYHRVGPVFQGRYKAVLVETDEQLLHLSRYIHLNPTNYLNIPISNWQQIHWPYSLPEFFGVRQTTWVNPTPILDYFNKTSKNNSYQSFMSENIDPEIVAPLALDDYSE